MTTNIWGLDIGSTGIRAIELTRTWNSYRVTDYRFRPLDPAGGEDQDIEVLQALREMFPEGIKRKGFVIPIASHRTMVHKIPLPFKERKKNLRIVKYEIEPLLPVPAEQVVVDFYSLKVDQGDHPALVFAAPKEHLRHKLSLVKEAGLDPESLIPEAMALFWAMKYLDKALTVDPGGLLDVGHKKTTLIVWCDGVLVLARSIPIGGEEVWQSRGTGRPEASPTLSRLAGEVLRTLMALESEAPAQTVSRIFLTGGLTALPGAEAILENHIQREVRILDPIHRVPGLHQAVPEGHQQVLTVALGAALWGAAPESERLNFRQEELISSQKVRREKSRVHLLLAYGIILALLAMGGLFTNLYLQERKYRELKKEIRQEFSQALPGVKKIVNEVQQMKTFVQEEKARVVALGGMGNENSPLEILREISTIFDPNWKVKLTELTIDSEGVEVNGEADSFDTINQLKSRLDRSSLYQDVQLKAARASNLENIIEFRIQMKRRI